MNNLSLEGKMDKKDKRSCEEQEFDFFMIALDIVGKFMWLMVLVAFIALLIKIIRSLRCMLI